MIAVAIVYTAMSIIFSLVVLVYPSFYATDMITGSLCFQVAAFSSLCWYSCTSKRAAILPV